MSKSEIVSLFSKNFSTDEISIGSLEERKTQNNMKYISIPIFYNDDKFKIKLKNQHFKVFVMKNQFGTNWSLGIKVTDDNCVVFMQIQQRIQSLIKNEKQNVKNMINKTIYANGFNIKYTKDNDNPKVYAKLFSSNDKISTRFNILTKNKNIREVSGSEYIQKPLFGDVVFTIHHVFIGNAYSIVIYCNEVLIKEVIRQKSHFSDGYKNIEESEDKDSPH